MANRAPRRSTHPEPNEVCAADAAARLGISVKTLHEQWDAKLWPRVERLPAGGGWRRWYKVERISALAVTLAILKLVGEQVRAVKRTVIDGMSEAWAPDAELAAELESEAPATEPAS